MLCMITEIILLQLGGWFGRRGNILRQRDEFQVYLFDFLSLIPRRHASKMELVFNNSLKTYETT